jgi:LVIVD repeat
MHLLTRVLAAAALTAGLVGLPASATAAPTPAALADPGTGSPNVRPLAHVPLGGAGGGGGGGSDIEFATLDVTGLPGSGGTTGVRTFALAGSLGRGLQIIDVTNARRPSAPLVYDCRVSQGDIQVFDRGTRTLVTYAADYGVTLGSACYADLTALGVDVGNGLGSVIVDISNPYRPRTVGFAKEPRGTHNMTVHPSGGYLYNSNSDFRAQGTIEVFDMRGARLRSPVKVADLTLTGGSDSHDITFNEDGTRAYSAALTHTVILDTSDPAHPAILGRIVDPAIQIHHQADPITVTDPELGTRTLLVVTDEVNGGSSAPCPGGGLHVYDVTGSREAAPVKLGTWFISDVTAPDGRGCTAHVLRMHPDEGILTMAWYRKGVRVLDISGLASATAGQSATPMRQIGWFAFDDANTWAAKTPRIGADGSFFLFANDIQRGVDVFRFDASAPEATDPGVWVPAGGGSASRASVTAVPTGQPFACVLPVRT